MSTKPFIPLLGKRIRVTRLDECGAYPEAAESDAFIATGGFVTVSLSAEVEDGEEILKKRADGSICVNEKQSDSFKNFTIEMEFCDVNPSLIALMTNAEPYEDYEGDVVGFTVPEGSIDKFFALEIWTGLSGQACEGGTSQSGYMLLPFVQAGVLGDIEITGEDTIDFSMTGAYTKGGHGWGVGPYDVAMDDGTPSALPTALDPFDHFLMMTTEVAPPDEDDDPQPMP